MDQRFELVQERQDDQDNQVKELQSEIYFLKNDYDDTLNRLDREMKMQKEELTKQKEEMKKQREEMIKQNKEIDNKIERSIKTSNNFNEVRNDSNKQFL